MPTYPFFDQIPQPNDNPSDSQPQLLRNNQSTFGIFGTNHVNFGSTGNDTGYDGYHRVIQFQTQNTTDPTPINAPAKRGQLYTKTVSGDEALFYENGSGTVTQLTTNTGVSSFTTYLSGTWLQTNAYTNIVAIPANVYGTIYFFGNTLNAKVSQTGSFYSTGTNVYAYANRGRTNSPNGNVQYPVELNNNNAALFLQGQQGDSILYGTFQFRVQYWAI